MAFTLCGFESERDAVLERVFVGTLVGNRDINYFVKRKFTIWVQFKIIDMFIFNIIFCRAVLCANYLNNDGLSKKACSSFQQYLLVYSYIYET